jgi:hypothetical protein
MLTIPEVLVELRQFYICHIFLAIFWTCGRTSLAISWLCSSRSPLCNKFTWISYYFRYADHNDVLIR